jgi:hypothetical protein
MQQSVAKRVRKFLSNLHGTRETNTGRVARPGSLSPGPRAFHPGAVMTTAIQDPSREQLIHTESSSINPSLP